MRFDALLTWLIPSTSNYDINRRDHSRAIPTPRNILFILSVRPDRNQLLTRFKRAPSQAKFAMYMPISTADSERNDQPLSSVTFKISERQERITQWIGTVDNLAFCCFCASLRVLDVFERECVLCELSHGCICA